MTKLVFIDHYDSFSANLLDWLGRGGFGVNDIEIVLFDDSEKMSWVVHSKFPVVLSPGPKRPENAVETLNLTSSLLGQVPILGVCLGHQILGHVTGSNSILAADPWHGHLRGISVLSEGGFFLNCPMQFDVMLYNSLVVERSTLRPDWQILAENSQGEVMAMALVSPRIPTIAVQFHPESFMTECGDVMAKNWHRLLH